MKPRVAAQADLLRFLRDAADEVARGGSFEGSIRWELLAQCPDPHHTDPQREGPCSTCQDGPPYAAAVAYRVGNDMGQGGMVLYGSTGGAQPVEPWGPLDRLLAALQKHLDCPDCGGTGQLRRQRDPYATGKGTYVDECFCLVRLRDADRKARQAVAQQVRYMAEMQALGADTVA